MAEEGAGNGTLLISTGSVLQIKPAEIKQLAAALEKLPTKVLWKLSQKEQDRLAALDPAFRFPANVKVVKWMPQNDVLGHPGTRAFLTHAGSNSIYEAGYHGVPLVAIPLGADQWDMSSKAQYAGFALGLPKGRDTPPDEIAAALERVLTEPQYREAARKVSIRLRTRETTPAQEAAQRIELVMATGGDPFLRSPADELPFMVRHNLDVPLVLLLAAVAIVALLVQACRSVLQIWRKRAGTGVCSVKAKSA
eukprot:jgi/Botrbrau1/17039/Bobra.49_2s0095.1